MIKPFKGDYILSRGFGGVLIAADGKYGTHKGVDWALPIGTPLIAAMSGVVTYAAWAVDAGNTVTVRNGDNLYKCFHMSKIDVVVGQQVKEGQLIGLSGNSGNTTGPHVHFQVEIPAGNPVDPEPLLKNEGDKDMPSTLDRQLATIVAKAFYGPGADEGAVKQLMEAKDDQGHLNALTALYLAEASPAHRAYLQFIDDLRKAALNNEDPELVELAKRLDAYFDAHNL